jgi:ligand-binding SRPBCC domain-containing protein
LSRFSNRFIVRAPIEKVWNFYTDIKHLEIITPQKLDLKVMHTTNDKISTGQECTISAKMLTRKRWRSKIVACTTYEYTDEMLEGPFKKWKHVHKFNEIGRNETEIIDEIDFELSYGIIGRLVNFYIIHVLEKIFENRRIATKIHLDKIY